MRLSNIQEFSIHRLFRVEVIYTVSELIFLARLRLNDDQSLQCVDIAY